MATNRNTARLWGQMEVHQEQWDLAESKEEESGGEREFVKGVTMCVLVLVC